MRIKKSVAWILALTLMLTMTYTTGISYAVTQPVITEEDVSLSWTEKQVYIDWDEDYEKGEAKVQVPEVTVEVNGTVLTEEEDYIVEAPQSANAATYSVTVIGQGAYGGEAVKNYAIKPIEMEDTDWDADETFDVYDYTGYRYTGKNITAKHGVVEYGAVREWKEWYPLTEGVDYEVVEPLSGNTAKKIGAHYISMKIEGIGNYTGSATVEGSFCIYPKKVKITSAKSTKKKQITVKWTKTANCDGYAISYIKGNWEGKEKTKYVSGKSKTSCTLKNLTSKKKYIIVVEPYKKVNGEKIRYWDYYYETGKNITKVKVK